MISSSSTAVDVYTCIIVTGYVLASNQSVKDRPQLLSSYELWSCWFKALFSWCHLSPLVLSLFQLEIYMCFLKYYTSIYVYPAEFTFNVLELFGKVMFPFLKNFSVLRFIFVIPIEDHFCNTSVYIVGHTAFTIHNICVFTLWPGHVTSFLALCLMHESRLLGWAYAECVNRTRDSAWAAPLELGIWVWRCHKGG